jgi:hypothetical protein
MFSKYTRRFQNCIPETGLVFLLGKKKLTYTNLIMVGQ